MTCHKLPELRESSWSVFLDMTDLPEDQRLLDLLDDYVVRLQGGDMPDRDALLRARPPLGQGESGPRA